MCCVGPFLGFSQIQYYFHYIFSVLFRVKKKFMIYCSCYFVPNIERAIIVLSSHKVERFESKTKEKRVRWIIY
jgi:hypothetical protein